MIRKNGDVTETFTVDGFVAGTWTVVEKRGIATLHLTPFAPLSSAIVGDLEAEGHRLLGFLAPQATASVIEIGADLS